MRTNKFEDAFAEFLDRHEYDEAEHYLFSMVRLAFSAGWQAAGGVPPQSERVFEVLFPPVGEQEEKRSGPEFHRSADRDIHSSCLGRESSSRIQSSTWTTE